MLVVGIVCSVAFDLVVNFWVCTTFRGDSARFSAEVLAPFPFVSGRGNLFSQWAWQCDVVDFQQGSARVPGWNSARVLSQAPCCNLKKS